VQGSSVSCTPGSDVIDLGAVYAGVDYSTLWCRAQRTAPFIVQMLFNLVLYSMVRVYLIVFTPLRMNPLTKRTKHALQYATVGYCIGVPWLCLGLALGLDYLDTGPTTSQAQYASQAALCVPRLSSQRVEFAVVYLPYIVTGAAVVVVSGVVLAHVRNVRRRATRAALHWN